MQVPVVGALRLPEHVQLLVQTKFVDQVVCRRKQLAKACIWFESAVKIIALAVFHAGFCSLKQNPNPSTGSHSLWLVLKYLNE